MVPGETTPGPLIMVVAFVGAGIKAIFWPQLVLLAGVAGAGVATFPVHPCWRYAGGVARRGLKFTAPLTGKSAAVG